MGNANAGITDAMAKGEYKNNFFSPKEREDKAGSALLRKWKIGRWQAIVLVAGLIGLVLLCVSSLPTSPKAAGTQNPAQESIRIDLTAYEQQLERRLGEIIGAIAGAGETRVMLTLECGSEPIYAVQGSSDSSHSVTDGGTEESLRADKEYVIIGTGAGEQGLVLKMLEPQVRGVAVICRGGDDLIVRQAVVEAVTAVLGIGSNKVSVAKMGMTG